MTEPIGVVEKKIDIRSKNPLRVKIQLTHLQCFDRDGGRVVPEAFPYFAELSRTQLPNELERVPVDLPLVPRAVT